MADSKLSGLPAGAAIGATDLFYTVQGGASVSTTGQQQIDLAKANVTKADVGLGSVPNTDTTNASNISSGTLAATRGGAGAVSGVMVADGAGNVAAAVSGTDLKTINSTSVLGSGNISVSASPAGSSEIGRAHV